MKKQILAAACAALLSAGIAVGQVGFHIRIGPPPPRREVVPPPPREHHDWVWHPGYQRWDGHAYVWVSGEYVAPPRPHARWVSGHWAHRHGEYVWIEGHWR